MSIGFNSMGRAVGKSIATFVSLTAVVSVFAGPAQLDVLGLIPGESEWAQVKQLGPEINPGKSVRLEIGGHKMPCVVSLTNGKLSHMMCLIGKGTGKYDTYTEASNTEVYSTLLTGFTKKFGKPDSVNKGTVRTRIGVEYEQEFAVWRDKRGNELSLASMVDSVSMGGLIFESANYLKEKKEKDAAKDSERKF